MVNPDVDGYILKP